MDEEDRFLYADVASTFDSESSDANESRRVIRKLRRTDAKGEETF